MSGGHYEYKQRALGEIASMMEEDIDNANTGVPSPNGEVIDIPEDILSIMRDIVFDLLQIEFKVDSIDKYREGDLSAGSLRSIFSEMNSLILDLNLKNDGATNLDLSSLYVHDDASQASLYLDAMELC